MARSESFLISFRPAKDAWLRSRARFARELLECALLALEINHPAHRRGVILRLREAPAGRNLRLQLRLLAAEVLDLPDKVFRDGVGNNSHGLENSKRQTSKRQRKTKRWALALGLVEGTHLFGL